MSAADNDVPGDYILNPDPKHRASAVARSEAIGILNGAKRWETKLDYAVNAVLDNCITKVDELPNAVPHASLKGSFPVVLYFGTRADADEFIAMVRQAKPGLKLKNL